MFFLLHPAQKTGGIFLKKIGHQLFFDARWNDIYTAF